LLQPAGRSLPTKRGLHPKIVSGLSVDYNDEVKRTNEIKTAAPRLDAIDIAGLDITADALLTQRDLAKYVFARGAHYHFSGRDRSAARTRP